MMKKVIIILLFLCSAVVCFLLFELFGTVTDNNIEIYKDLKSGKYHHSYTDLVPDISDFGNYKKIDFKYFEKHKMIFRSEAYTLVADYNKNTYSKAKTGFYKSYTFYNTPIKNDPYVSDIKLYPSFYIDGFKFKVVRGDDEFFPKHIYFLGFNDKENKIAFIYYRDTELDYIESFEDHIGNECGWD